MPTFIETRTNPMTVTALGQMASMVDAAHYSLSLYVETLTKNGVLVGTLLYEIDEGLRTVEHFLNHASEDIQCGDRAQAHSNINAAFARYGRTAGMLEDQGLGL